MTHASMRRTATTDWGGVWLDHRRQDHRECHLKPDLLLIYRKPDNEVLQLVRMGSHSELFG
jgi:addiction module RelE/StbE family toxin